MNDTPSHATAADAASAGKPTNFLRAIVERDLQLGSYAQKRWAGSPGDASHHAQASLDAAAIRTRFPPEPNGYLHIGHAKSICLNFGLARDYAGVCHLRMDDTNPEKEDQEYVDGIIDAVRWLGFDWRESRDGQSSENLYFASDYFGFMYHAAEALVQAGLAYVDEQSAQEMRERRGDFTTPGVDSPYRDRDPQVNLARLREMRDGLHADGTMVLRAKIDMASPNINLRDPAIYRIRRATHHRTGDTWCIYPMYTFAHPIEDALERITHSICTLEFEDQRPFYDWLLQHLAQLGLLQAPLPQQYEFARLNLSHVITSKRKLKALVDEALVEGWDDPRLPTLVGLRRRGYTPQALQLFCERIGVSKSDSWIDYSTLEIALRDDLEHKAHRGMAVLDPIRLELVNWDEVFGAGHLEPCTLPALPHAHDEGTEPPMRHVLLGPEVWIEREDFEAQAPKGYKRLFPGNSVRLKGGFVVECVGARLGEDGELLAVQAKVVPDTKSGTPGADRVKVKAAITWVGMADGVAAEIRLFERLFLEAQPDAGGRDFRELINPHSRRVVQGYVEPSLAQAQPDDKFQFERFGYFVADAHDHRPGKPVFNRITTLKDSWGK